MYGKYMTQAEAMEKLHALEKAKAAPERVLALAFEEVEQLGICPLGSREHAASQDRLDWILGMPWSMSKTPSVSFKEAKEALDSMVFAQDKAKKALLSISFSPPTGSAHPPVWVYGPRGSGKTRLIEALAVATKRPIIRLGREFFSKNSGNVGYFARILRMAGQMNPIVLVDGASSPEKEEMAHIIGAFESGAPCWDGGLGLYLDISNILLVMTQGGIRHPHHHTLFIETHPYTLHDKLRIADSFIIPEACMRLGKKNYRFTRAALEFLALGRTRESGVAQLEREITAILRELKNRREMGQKVPAVIGLKTAVEITGGAHRSRPSPHSGIGRVNGLCYDGMDGSLLPAEVLAFPGEAGKRASITMTGSLGEILRESTLVAHAHVVSSLKSYKLSEEDRSRLIHVHLQDASTPKDGPSLGVGLVMGIVSALRGKPIRDGIAVTGEITLGGKAKGVGAIQEKMEAAVRAGLHTIIVPEENEGDVNDVRGELYRFIKVILVSDTAEAVAIAIDGKKAGRVFKASKPLRKKSKPKQRRGRQARAPSKRPPDSGSTER